MADLEVKRFLFAVAVIVNEPLPLPRDGEILIHDRTLLVTCHDSPVVTSMVLLVAVLGKASLDVDKLKLRTGVGVGD